MVIVHGRTATRRGRRNPSATTSEGEGTCRPFDGGHATARASILPGPWSVAMRPRRSVLVPAASRRAHRFDRTRGPRRAAGVMGSSRRWPIVADRPSERASLVEGTWSGSQRASCSHTGLPGRASLRIDGDASADALYSRITSARSVHPLHRRRALADHGTRFAPRVQWAVTCGCSALPHPAYNHHL